MGAKKKVYLDDVFSTYVYKGNESARAINNGIDLSGEGGLVWAKARNDSHDHHLVDTVRGANKILESNTTDAEATIANRITGFNSNGFNLGSAGQVNGTSAYNYSSWSFRKAKGFFDIVTYTGNGTAGRTVSHNLGCVPGLILVKRTSSTNDWEVYHRSLGATKDMRLNTNAAAYTSTARWNDTEPTSSVFTLGTDGAVNGNGDSFVAYLFAGGESTAATAKSCPFDGNNDSLTLAASNDFDFGTGDFTLEFWMKPDTTSSTAPMSLGSSASAGGFQMYTSDFKMKWYFHDGSNADYRLISPVLTRGAWQHIAVVRSSNTITLYYNGTAADTYNASGKSVGQSSNNFVRIGCGGENSAGAFWDGAVSNLRIVKGTAVYTSSFKPPTEPLTNITNTKLLCCNNSSATTATVTPGTITGNGGLSQGSDDSPFDDPAAFKFGENEDQGIIKCGSYTGNGNATGPEINLGFEPQWILLKNTASNNSWRIYDSMRGIVTNGSESLILPDSSGSELAAYQNEIDLTPTGFKVKTTDGGVNHNNGTLIFVAIRRPDGYVGKPYELGTDVFGMTTGRGSGTLKPDYLSSFPVDFTIHRQIASTDNWHSSARLIQGYNQYPNKTDGQSTNSDYAFDYSDGWGKASWGSDRQSWMWKRHAGFDVVAYKGYEIPGVRAIPHNLGKVPEMVWLKARNYENYGDWYVYHKGLNGGTNPEQYHLALNDNDAEVDSVAAWGDTAPTSTHWTVGNDNAGNGTYDYIAFLFASVDGVSKVGYFDGSSSSQTITTGFQPRFLIVKKTTEAGNWYMVDTTRGWVSGTDKQIKLDLNQVQYDGNMGYPTSTGFTITSNSNWNGNGQKYIYYAHA